MAGGAPRRGVGPRARRGGTARGLPPSPPPAPSADLRFLTERETSASLPLSLLNLRPGRCSCGAPSVGRPRRGGGDSLGPRERVGGALGALGGSAAILSGGAAGHGGAGVRKSCKATQGRGSRVKLPSLPLAVARSSSLGHPAVLGIGVSDPFGAWSSLPGFAFPPLLGFPQSQAAPYMPAPCPPRPPADAADPAL